LDHLGKRTRERIKSSIGVCIGGQHTFGKVNLAIYMNYAGICNSTEEAEVLLMPLDAIDVYEMVLCLQAIAMFSRMSFESYDRVFQGGYKLQSSVS